MATGRLSRILCWSQGERQAEGNAWARSSHVDPIVILNLGSECVGLSGCERRDATEDLALLVDSHLNLIEGILDPITTKHLSQVLCALLNLLWPAIWQRVVFVGELILHAGDLVDLQSNQVLLHRGRGKESEARFQV